MPSIKDSNATTLADHSISMEVNQSNFKTLDPDDALAHLTMLAKMLSLSYQLVSKRLPKDGGTNPDLLKYFKKLQDTLEAIVMKHTLDAGKANSDIQLSCTIDPSDSGFPVVVRDFKFLNSDKEQAEAELQALPDDGKLVDDALYLLFRGHLPRDVILQKLTRNYYEMLQQLSMPKTLEIYPLTDLQQEKDFHYCTQSFERLDDHSNLPRFYTLYLRIPSKSYNKPEWREELKQAITGGLSTVTDLELRYLAEKVEGIIGVQLEYLERFDIGPFYSLYTENGKAVSALVESGQDCIMMYSKSSVIRTGQAERDKLRERFVGWISGDEHAGQFSPVITSPQYVLMPHRLIQKVHNLNITLKEHIKMYGVTSEGEMYE